ncbi:MAG: peptide-methionine (S)-S-oxide reductase [Planctomycetota bacterium]|nr:MAG: peptide-methionine (S)-S-oxide reductase [Planctomycetota bacterium]REJ89077.1 MAG: peptide-methionine (S)-S-oxide reductase [Planctomycetota bacterium]REK25215.1 MAG: peptide-methionine (S)-S-oxide reductase [Planctomycetota bacterium]REK32115.1 MAG: peptide-methionine (S)-S-oxide reductase [Planctomycetota bacterium]
MANGSAVATFGGGCFWCTEAVFLQMRGVQSVVSGYSGGSAPNPTYEQVCSKQTGHAEVIQITYDPEVVSFAELLDVFFHTHDPTTVDRQGNDVGPQYRSVIFYHDEQQREVAEAVKAELDQSGRFDGPIVTSIEPLSEFYPAEDYHQDYFARNPRQPYCAMVVAPKVEKARTLYSGRLIDS